MRRFATLLALLSGLILVSSASAQGIAPQPTIYQSEAAKKWRETFGEELTPPQVEVLKIIEQIDILEKAIATEPDLARKALLQSVLAAAKNLDTAAKFFEGIDTPLWNQAKEAVRQGNKKALDNYKAKGGQTYTKDGLDQGTTATKNQAKWNKAKSDFDKARTLYNEARKKAGTLPKGV